MNTKKLRIQGLIYSRYDDYANRLASGWMQQMIVDELKEEGYVLTRDYFSKCFSKARKKRMAKHVVVATEPKPAAHQEEKPQAKSPAPVPPKSADKFRIPVLSDEELF